MLLIEQNVGALEIADLGIVMQQGRVLQELRGDEFRDQKAVSQLLIGCRCAVPRPRTPVRPSCAVAGQPPAWPRGRVAGWPGGLQWSGGPASMSVDAHLPFPSRRGGLERSGGPASMSVDAHLPFPSRRGAPPQRQKAAASGSQIRGVS